MYGYVGKILRIDLTQKTYNLQSLNEEEAIKYVGGRGLGTKIMYDEVDPLINAFDPANKVIIATGPITGTPTPAGGRYMVITKSPLTGTIASSNSGGYWGAELKFAGYDALILEGKSENPVYLVIEDEKIEFRDASHLWGKTTIETTSSLLKETPEKSKVMCIGPAGENLSRIAGVMNDIDRTAGRSGVGAVVGSKNLKAIVVKGSSRPLVAKKDELRSATKKGRVKLKEKAW